MEPDDPVWFISHLISVPFVTDVELGPLFIPANLQLSNITAQYTLFQNQQHSRNMSTTCQLPEVIDITWLATFRHIDRNVCYHSENHLHHMHSLFSECGRKHLFSHVLYASNSQFRKVLDEYVECAA
ncbi:hypothetical protein AVEN_206818-1 [Araneus ventricosus]|uniref:Uncharacterized protein n=1 Tax=Araneus ventricosus TaxID=182803 RepID=A0A4Y2C4M5_ARAVE|nr:hypothetical protein AVEN_206818-1 [Araneus ventricosus]